VAATLKSLGFDVDVQTDATKQGMEDAFARLARKARDADLTLIFYAGHGLQDQGKNYLAPVDASLTDETDLRRRFVRLDDVLDDLAGAKGARILLIDACRDNGAVDALQAAVRSSRSGSISRGLALVPKTDGQLVAFATLADHVAADGEGSDSPFATALVAHLAPSPTSIAKKRYPVYGSMTWCTRAPLSGGGANVRRPQRGPNGSAAEQAGPRCFALSLNRESVSK
jgi:uncharacterized caspase-like protein